MKLLDRRRATRLQRHRLGGVVWLCAIAASLLWAGCSIEKNYKTLSFFFDGVPDPEARARVAAAGGITEDIRKSPTYSIHKPFATEACKECHSDRFQLTTQDSSICLKCHEDQTSKLPKMHGPVAAAACLWCHSPHESAQAHLLKAPARQVCSQCHEAALLNSVRVPAHADPKQSCLDCHNGHGGTATFFLREGVSRPAPSATPPAVPGPTPK
jgi:predicted CXXCH cytochrome family protein